jgi:hypothetical protein
VAWRGAAKRDRVFGGEHTRERNFCRLTDV